jgi:hypothetical protein
MPVPQKKLVPTGGWKIETDLKAGKKNNKEEITEPERYASNPAKISQGDFYL